MFKNTSKRTRSIVALSAVFAVAGSGAAFAYWTSLGTGDGTAATSAGNTALVVTASSTQTGTLEPGGSTVVSFTVTNPGTGSLKLNNNVSVTFADSEGTPWTGTGGCLPASYSAEGSLTDGEQDIAGGATVSGSVTVSMLNLSTNQNACKNVQVPLHISVS